MPCPAFLNVLGISYNNSSGTQLPFLLLHSDGHSPRDRGWPPNVILEGLNYAHERHPAVSSPPATSGSPRAAPGESQTGVGDSAGSLMRATGYGGKLQHGGGGGDREKRMLRKGAERQ